MTWKILLKGRETGAVPIAKVYMDMDMNTYMSNTCYMSISMLHAHVYGVFPCTCPCCMSISMIMSMSGLHVYVNAACSSPGSTDKDMQHGHGHAAWT